jgi:hypothetical protein
MAEDDGNGKVTLAVLGERVGHLVMMVEEMRSQMRCYSHSEQIKGVAERIDRLEGQRKGERTDIKAIVLPVIAGLIGALVGGYFAR